MTKTITAKSPSVSANVAIIEETTSSPQLQRGAPLMTSVNPLVRVAGSYPGSSSALVAGRGQMTQLDH
jgi:hypothetical protein